MMSPELEKLLEDYNFYLERTKEWKLHTVQIYFEYEDGIEPMEETFLAYNEAHLLIEIARQHKHHANDIRKIDIMKVW